jgi:hypothetical protein
MLRRTHFVVLPLILLLAAACASARGMPPLQAPEPGLTAAASSPAARSNIATSPQAVPIGTASPSPTSMSAPGATVVLTMTQVITYTPPAPTGPTQSGNCWTESLVTPRSGAWRCMIGNLIYDPCFSLTGVDGVVCGNPLTGGPSLQLQLTQPLPTPFPATPSPMRANRPWALRTADGTGCLFITGASSLIDGKRINYECYNAQGTLDPYLVVLGEPQPGQVWTADEATTAPGNNGIIATRQMTVMLSTVWK